VAKLEYNYQELVEWLPQPLMETDLEGRVTFANPSARDCFGFHLEKLDEGLSVLSIMQPAARQNLQQLMQELAPGMGAAETEVHLIVKDGSSHPFLIKLAAIEKGSTVVGFRLLCIDIAERVKIAETLCNTEQICRTIFAMVPLGIIQFDENGVILDCNDRCLQIFGARREQLVGRKMVESLRDEDMKGALEEALSGGSGFFEGEFIAATGENKLYVRALFCQSRSDSGEFVFALGMVEDVTEQRQTEIDLKRNEARYRAIVEDQTELICRFLPDGAITFVNDAYCRFFGETPEQLIGNSFWHHLPAADQQQCQQHLARLNQENPVSTIEHRVFSASGEIRWQQWTDRAILDEHGKVVEIQSVGRDITKRKQAEEALQESEKQLRRLSAQILQAQEQERQRIALDLHDSVIQALATIKVSLGISLKQLKQKNFAIDLSPFESVLAMLHKTIDEVRTVCSDLRPSMLDNLGILATISWACQEFGEVHKDVRVRVHTDIQEAEVPEHLKIVIYRILQEALNNAAKHSHADLVDVSLKIDREAIRLVIADNGCGFEAPQLSVNSNNGRGLGLLGMKERTELSDGAFAIDSAKGCGTTVRSVWLLDRLDRKGASLAKGKGQEARTGSWGPA